MRDKAAESAAWEVVEQLNDIADAWGVPAEVMSQHVAAFFQASVLRKATEDGIQVAQDMAVLLARTELSCRRLCDALPHIPRCSVEAFSQSYGSLTLYLLTDDEGWGDVQSQFKIVAAAAFAAGTALGGVAGAVDELKRRPEALKDAARNNALKAAAARHAENRQMKTEVRDWYSQRRSEFPNKDIAAIEAKKLVPAAMSTIRGWLKGI